MSLHIAGRTISHPDVLLIDYLKINEWTVRNYDMPGPGDPLVLTAAEVVRTRVINSRISGRQRDYFVERTLGAIWTSIPIDARLADADPALHGGLNDDALGVYDHYWKGRPTFVSHGKISKVLHVKHPGLFPILDSKLRTVYRKAARTAASRHNIHGRRAVKRAFWVAIRDDLTDPDNAVTLAKLRRLLEGHHGEVFQWAAKNLTDVRMLDMITWKL